MGRLLYTLFFLLGICLQQCACARCKVAPGSSTWPSDADWQALNTSVSGRLIKPTPPGAVCHSDRAEYDNASCNALITQWTNALYHLTTPATVNYNDISCLPSPLAPCSSSGYPAYVIAATSASDVQAGVKFAAKTGVRLIVKGTGHDWPGRSSGPGALSIWTHNIRGIDFDTSDSRIFNGAIGTAKIGAGMTVGEILRAGADQNYTLVTGSDASVGIGGWIAGGGHGPVTSRFGMGADQVVEMEVVTSQGELLTINKNSQADLFWAMRGGGGSTFGVMVSATVLVYPNLPMALLYPTYNTTAGSNTFWDLMALVHSYIPKQSDAGVMGYYYIYANVTEPGIMPRSCIFGTLLVPEKSITEAQALLAPMEKAIRSSSWADQANVSNTAIPPHAYESYADTWSQHQPEAVGDEGRVGSRLLDEKALTADVSALATALQKAMPANDIPLITHLVTGPGPRKIDVPGGNAVLPAWRSAYAHLVVPIEWAPLDDAEKAAQLAGLQANDQALKDIAPDTGSYMSESDPTDPTWQETFWGSNYPRLLSIKKKWDPDGVFWCIPCVGHELWTVTGGDGLGQDGGTICQN